MTEKVEIPKHVNTQWVRLVCDARHHVIAWTVRNIKPRVGEEVWCPLCSTMSTVESLVAPSELRIVTCGETKCYTRNWGTASLLASRAATRHSQGNPGHEVTVCDGVGRVLQKSKRDAGQGKLDF